MEQFGYLPPLRRWWWLLIAATFVAGSAGAAVANRMTPTYEAEAQVLVGPINTDRDTLLASGQLAQTYAELATRGPLLEAAVEALALDISPRRLRASVSASANDITRLVSIKVRDQDATRAAAVANTVADHLARESTGDSTDVTGLVTVIDPAATPQSPVQPQVPLIVGLAGIVGLVGALAVVLGTERLRDRIGGPQELAELTHTDVIGVIPRPNSPAARRSALIVDGAPHSDAATSYRLLAAKLQFGPTGEAINSMVVMSPRVGRAGTDVAVNLAAALAASGRDVLLAGFEDAGRTGELLGVPSRPGLISRLAAGEPVELVEVPVGHGRSAYVLPHDPLARETLTPSLAVDVLRSQTGQQGVAIVSVDPIAESSNAVIWARAADAVVLVVDPKEVRRRDVVRAIEAIRPVTAGVTAPVLYDGHGRHPAPLEKDHGDELTDGHALAVRPDTSVGPPSADATPNGDSGWAPLPREPAVYEGGSHE